MKRNSCIAAMLAIFPSSAFAAGEAGVELGQSSNAYRDRFSDGDQFVGANAKVDIANPLSKKSRLFYGAGANHRQYFSETDANTSSLYLDSEYLTLAGKSREFSQRFFLQYADSPNFLRQRLSSYTLYSASKLTSQLKSSDLVVTLPVQAKLYGQQTDGRSGPGDMFEEPFKEDNYMVGLDGAWRLYLDKKFQKSIMMGVSTDARFFSDKPATRTDGSIFDSDDPRSGTKSRDVLTRLKLSYKSLTKRLDLEPGAELGYNYDLNHGSEDYFSYLLRFILRFSTRILEVSNSISYDHKDYLQKRSDIADPANSPKLRLTNLQDEFKTVYRLNKKLNTGGGLRYQRFSSNFDNDSYEVKEFFGLVSYTF